MDLSCSKRGVFMKKLFCISVVLSVLLYMTGCFQTEFVINLPETFEITVGEIKEIPVTVESENPDVDSADITYEVTSSDEEKVIIADNKNLWGIAEGEAKVIVAIKDSNAKAEMKVTVYPKIREIKTDNIQLTVGDKDIEVKYTTLPENAKGTVQVSVASPDVVEVIDGKLYAIAAGETELILSAGNVSQTARITVKPSATAASETSEVTEEQKNQDS